MLKRIQVISILGLMGIALLISGIRGPAHALPVCGPGAHWVDTCTSDTDAFPSVATVGLDFDLDNTSDVSLVLSGPTVIKRGDPIDTSDPLDLVFNPHFNKIRVMTSLALPTSAKYLHDKEKPACSSCTYF